MDSVAIIEAFKEELERAGLRPRDVSPLIGMSHTTIYRILSGRAPTSQLSLRAMQMFTKFLRWYNEAFNKDLVEDGISEYFEQWLLEVHL